MVAAAVALEACGDGQIGPNAPLVSNTGPVTINIADYPGLAATGSLVRVQNETIGVVRTGPASFVASSTICTHEGCDTDVRNNQFQCPCHDSLFAATGDLLRGPATRGLDRLPTAFDAPTNTLKIG